MKYPYLLFFLFVITLSLNGQTSEEDYQDSAIEERSFDQETWQDATEEDETEIYSPNQAYQDAPLEERNFDAEKWAASTKDLPYDKKLKTKKERSSSASAPFEWGNFLQFIAIIGLITIVIALLIYSLGKGGLRLSNKKINPISADFDLAAVEDNLEESNVQDFLQQALSAGNYSLAVRLFYLDILKHMTEQNLIKWKRDKTNRAYKLELGNHNLALSFKDVTRVFEQVWYGNRLISASEYNSIAPRFDLLLQQIKAL